MHLLNIHYMECQRIRKNEHINRRIIYVQKVLEAYSLADVARRSMVGVLQSLPLWPGASWRGDRPSS